MLDRLTFFSSSSSSFFLSFPSSLLLSPHWTDRSYLILQGRDPKGTWTPGFAKWTQLGLWLKAVLEMPHFPFVSCGIPAHWVPGRMGVWGLSVGTPTGEMHVERPGTIRAQPSRLPCMPSLGPEARGPILPHLPFQSSLPPFPLALISSPIGEVSQPLQCCRCTPKTLL
jgi:hypothetical protein